MATVHDARVHVTREEADDVAKNDLGRPFTDDEWDDLRPRIESAMDDAATECIDEFIVDADEEPARDPSLPRPTP